jgi:hypothetical protein
MRDRIGFASWLALAIVCLAAAPVAAQTDPFGCGLGMLLKWDADGYAYETPAGNYNPATFISTAYNAGSNPNQSLHIVGIVTHFCAPLQDLDATDANTEYTFYMTGLQSAGTVGPFPVGSSTRWTTDYAGGTWEVWQDSPRDAPTAAGGGVPANPPNAQVPVRFTDGTKILEGTLSGFRTIVTRNSLGNYINSFRSDYLVTGPIGGQYYNRLVGTGGIIGAGWCPKRDPSHNPAANGLCSDPELPAGYSAHPFGKFDNPASPAEGSTWGAIKALYR